MTDIHSLTLLEMEVVKLVGDGLTNAEIAEELSYSKRTIANKIHALYRKFDLSDVRIVVCFWLESAGN